VVAAALLVDYILTVAVSVASGVDNIISALPNLDPWRVELAVGFVVLIILVNLRGVREASTAFAIPTYLFIGSVMLMIGTGLVRWMLGDAPIAESAQFAVQAEDLSQAALILLILRAFSSGCSALTGVEAVSNGVPAFRKPKVRNAQTTLVLMGSIAITMFAGLTVLALVAGVHYAENPCHLIGFDCRRSCSRASWPRSPRRRSATAASSSSWCRRRPPPSCCWPPTRRSTASRCWARCSPATATPRRRSTRAATVSSTRTA
jgi:hypothetical protein